MKTVTELAQQIADQELEACCSEVSWNGNKALAAELRDRRRPKPPSLKEKALALVSHNFSDQPCLSKEGYALIRRALETLDD